MKPRAARVEVWDPAPVSDAAERQKRRRARQEAERVLEGVARQRSKITYGDLAQRITTITYAPNGDPFSRLLCDISRASHSKGRGMLSAVVVHSGDGLPGDGFFALADELGAGGQDHEEVWQKQRAAVYRHWAKSTPAT